MVSSVLLTALMRRWAIAHNFTDKPGVRKIHAKPIALGGGVVIFWVVMLPLMVMSGLAIGADKFGVPGWLPAEMAVHVPGLSSRIVPTMVLIVCAGALHIMGIVDDLRHLGPILKLVIQLAVATLLATVGEIRFDFFIGSELLTTLLSILWMGVIINAFNFLDNMDGLSAGIAAICTAILLTAALNAGQVFVAGLEVLLIGALLGFLVFNFAPAKIFMGDGGSLVVGMLVAVCTIRTTYYHEHLTGGTWFATLMPLIVLAVPLYDFISVMLIRFWQGRSLWVGDTHHFSHRLLRRGLTVRQTALTIYLATACTGLGATFLHQVSQTGVILIFAQTVMIVFIIAILERP